MTGARPEKRVPNCNGEVGLVLGKILVWNLRELVGSRVRLSIGQKMVVVKEDVHRARKESDCGGDNGACLWQERCTGSLEIG